MKSVFKLVFLSGLLASCSAAPSASSLAGLTERRVHATYVTFTKWHDIAPIDGAVRLENGQCRLVAPQVSDDSTKWSPFQIYWAIKDKPSDVTKGTQLNDIFFAGDVVDASEFPGALGFAYLNTTYASMLKLESLETSEDGTAVRAKIGSPFSAYLRLQTWKSGDSCATQASYCQTAYDCTSDDAFAPLTAIHVKQNFLGYPTQVTYE